MAASALAIGLGMNAAQSFAPGSLPNGKIASPDSVIAQAQQREKGQEKGMGPGMGGGQGGPSMQNGGGKMRGEGGLGPGGSQYRSGEKGMRGEGGGPRSGGMQYRSEKGMRGEGGGQLRFGERGVRGERGLRGERGFRGERGYRGEFYREGRDRRHHGRGGVYFGPSYGYGPTGCSWLRRRALETDSPYWWRRYRACRGG
jgi:hypothetical protein